MYLSFIGIYDEMNDCLNRMTSMPNMQEVLVRNIRYRYTPHSFARFTHYVLNNSVTVIDGNADSLLDSFLEVLYSNPKFMLQPNLNIDLSTWLILMRFNMSRWQEFCSDPHEPYLKGIPAIVRLCMIIPRGVVSENIPWNAVLDTNLGTNSGHYNMQMTPHVAWIKRRKDGASVPNGKWYLCCRNFTLVEASPNDPEAELLVSTPVASRELAFASRNQTIFCLRLSQEGIPSSQFQQWMQKLGFDYAIFKCSLADTDRVSIACGVPQRANSESCDPKTDSKKIWDINATVTSFKGLTLKESETDEQPIKLQYIRADCNANGSIISFSGKLIFAESSRHLELLRNGAIVKSHPSTISTALILEFRLLKEENCETSTSLCIKFPYPVDVNTISLKIARKSAFIEFSIWLLNETNTSSAPIRLFDNSFNSLPQAAFPRVEVNSLPIITNQNSECSRQVVKDYVAIMKKSSNLQNTECLPFIEQLKTHLSRMVQSGKQVYTILSKVRESDASEQNLKTGFEIFVDCIRVDSDSRNLIIDAAIRLFNGREAKVDSIRIDAGSAENFQNWKEFLALSVERARAKWSHREGCVGMGSDGFLCECGKGLNLSEQMRRELEGQHYYRAAIPLLLPNPLVQPYHPVSTTREATSGSESFLKTVSRSAAASGTASASSESEPEIRKCEHCRIKEGSLRCSKCKSTYYCGPECQKAAWRTHKKTCI